MFHAICKRLLPSKLDNIYALFVVTHQISCCISPILLFLMFYTIYSIFWSHMKFHTKCNIIWSSFKFLTICIKKCIPWLNYNIFQPFATVFINFWILYHLQDFYITLQVLHHIYHYLDNPPSTIHFHLLSSIIYHISYFIISYLLETFSKTLQI